MILRTIVLVLGMGILLGLLASGCRQLASSPTLQWQPVASGMEMGQYGDPNDEEQTRVTAVRVDPTRCTIRAVDAHRGVAGQGSLAEKICPKVGAAINASFFAEDMTPLGMLITDGKRIQRRAPRRQWGLFRVRNGKPEIVRAVSTQPRGVTQALESKPRLIVDGKIQQFKPQGAERRSAVGIDRQGRLILAVTGDYLTLEEWAQVLQAQFGCVQALNLDGGSSTQLAVRGRVNRTVTGWHVPVFLTVTPKT